MKFLIIAVCVLFSSLFESSIYDINIEKYEGQQQYLSDYRGKKIIIAVLGDLATESEFLYSLDSIQDVHRDSIIVIAVPALDLAIPVTDTASLPDVPLSNVSVLTDTAIVEPTDNLLESLRDSLHLSLLVSKPVTVRKAAGNMQHRLFHWLTNASENQHFDEDITGRGQLFVVSTEGQLYAQLDIRVRPEIINQVLVQNYEEQPHSVADSTVTINE